MRTIFSIGLTLVVALAMAGACLADSESTLKQMLKKNGLRIGYDRKEKRLVSIGVAERHISAAGVADEGTV